MLPIMRTHIILKLTRSQSRVTMYSDSDSDSTLGTWDQTWRFMTWTWRQNGMFKTQMKISQCNTILFHYNVLIIV